MSALVENHAVVTRFIRKLRGGSQPILIEASDGFRYVLKFTNNPQGRNVLFNEAMGTSLYGAAGLPVPRWKPLEVTEEFLDRTPGCWLETANGNLRPNSGLCFGARFIGDGGARLWEILPGPSFSRVVNKSDFYLAWLLDTCARHTDNRQALFESDSNGIRAVFFDHGHMFSGPNGKLYRPNFRTSAYLDTRVYTRNPKQYGIDIAKPVINIDVDALWIKAEQLPKEWLTDSALRNFAACLCVLADANAVRNIAELIADFSLEKDQREISPQFQLRGWPNWILRAGIQGA